jgi:hypothetical protein
LVMDASTGKHLIEMPHTRLLPGALTNRTFATWTRGPVYAWDLPPRRNVLRLASLTLLGAMPRPGGSTCEERGHSAACGRKARNPKSGIRNLKQLSNLRGT